MPAPNGFVPTPDPVAAYTVSVAFGAVRPSERPDGGGVLLPGLGTGQLFGAIRRYCQNDVASFGPAETYPLPDAVGVEIDEARLQAFHETYPDAAVDIHQTDFLTNPPRGGFDWVIANPPYCRYKTIPEAKREAYSERFETATGQFPLYGPFVEQAMSLLASGGWATFILPLSGLMIDVTEPLRDLFRGYFVGPIRLLPRQSFDQQVATVLVSVQKDWARTTGDHLWIEPIRAGPLEAILERRGVDDVDAAATDYYDWFDKTRDRVRRRDRRERKTRDSTTFEPGGQASLARFAN